MFNNCETITDTIKQKVQSTLNNLSKIYDFDITKVNFEIEKTKNPKFGDYATNVAMSLGLDREKTLIVANEIADKLSHDSMFEQIDVINPGFINFKINLEYNTKILHEIFTQKDDFGKFHAKKLFYDIEFISANPTGLLHIGHARNAALGDSMARI